MSCECLPFQAEDGIGLPEEILDDQSSFEVAAKFYFIFIRFDFLWSLNYFALLLLNFFEVSKPFLVFNILYMVLYGLPFHILHQDDWLLFNLFKSPQKPLWCTQDSAISCNNREYYFLGQLPYLTGVESLIYEVGVSLNVQKKNIIWVRSVLTTMPKIDK